MKTKNKLLRMVILSVLIALGVVISPIEKIPELDTPFKITTACRQKYRKNSSN